MERSRGIVTLADAFLRPLPHGMCAAVTLSPPDAPIAPESLARLHPDEQAHASGLPERRRVSWIGGRLALHRALDAIGVDAGAIFSTPRGAPRIPPGARGSVSHKDTIAVALAAPVAPGPEHHIGIDVEIDASRKTDVSRHVLTEGERARLAPLPDDERLRIVTLHFSIKEAIYKAIDPFVQRYVGFHEVVVEPKPGGSVELSMHLKEGEGPFHVEAWWDRRDGIFLTTARAWRR